MAYSAGAIDVYDTAANLPTSGQPALAFAQDTNLYYSWSGAAWVPLLHSTRVSSITSSATPSINVSTTDQFEILTLSVAITGVTVTGTAVDGQQLRVRIKGDATPRAITWGASFVAGPAALLTTTAANKTHLSTFIYDSVAAKFVCSLVDATGY